MPIVRMSGKPVFCSFDWPMNEYLIAIVCYSFEHEKYFCYLGRKGGSYESQNLLAYAPEAAADNIYDAIDNRIAIEVAERMNL